jgi:hypothetical protein
MSISGCRKARPLGAVQLPDREFIDGVVVSDDLFPHPGINASEVIHFHLLLAQVIERRRARASKCIVVQENIVVKKVNLRDGCLGNEVKYVAACSASADDGNLRTFQLTIGRDDLRLCGCGIEVIEDRIVLLVRHDNRMSIGRDSTINRLCRAADDCDVCLDLFVVIRVLAGVQSRRGLPRDLVVGGEPFA